MRKILLIMILGIFLLNFVSPLSDLGEVEVNGTIQLRQTCATCSYVNFSVLDPDQNFTVSNTAMVNVGAGVWAYNYSDTTNLGRYDFVGMGDLNGIDTNFAAYFWVTKNGEATPGDSFNIFFYILFILTMIGLVYTCIFTILKVATVKETILGVLFSWLFLVLLIIVDYLAKNYILSMFWESATGLFLDIFIWSNGVLPVISLVIAMFVRGMQKKKPISAEELTGRFRYG